jgi:predicted  nucleic acid-binding Zn-ribbon protein
MTEKEFQDRLSELMRQIERLPAEQRADVQRLIEETRGQHDRVKKTLAELQEALDYLRLSVKYLVFDLEATRRENEYLRRLVESKGGEYHQSPPDDDDTH